MKYLAATALLIVLLAFIAWLTYAIPRLVDYTLRML